MTKFSSFLILFAVLLLAGCGGSSSDVRMPTEPVEPPPGAPTGLGEGGGVAAPPAPTP
jgi:hypothetical protein